MTSGAGLAGLFHADGPQGGLAQSCVTLQYYEGVVSIHQRARDDEPTGELEEHAMDYDPSNYRHCPR